ncbi:Fcf2 pre-rRNA processing-domain-containing protein [Lipomyces oligophaga]|uniref:Fcf2 pre-rRNA processing-domain-containing protein n=1 Tax=Lipomyces oligophaga TaxID=45792 RepID=UPI0034CEF997
MAETELIQNSIQGSKDDTVIELTSSEIQLEQTERQRAVAVLNRLPTLIDRKQNNSFLQSVGGVITLNTAKLESSLLGGNTEVRKVVNYSKIKRDAKEAKEATAGPDWFDMPAPEMTPSLRRDLDLLKMRAVLDPKRHYKRTDEALEKVKYLQQGTVISDPTEYFSSRLTKKQRKQTLADEILADSRSKEYFKRKYDEIQAVKMSGGKRHAKAVKAKRRGRR